MAFKRWDIVIAKVNRDPSIEAVVDFETKEWTVYISEWWRPLSYPTRLLIGEDKLFLKDKKIKVTRQRMQQLIREFFWEDFDYLNLQTVDSIVPGTILKIRNSKYVYLQTYDDSYYVLWRLSHDYALNKDFIIQIYWFTRSDLTENIRSKEDIVSRIFWEKVKVSDVIITDDWTWEDIE